MINLKDDYAEVQVPNGTEPLTLRVRQVGYLQAAPLLQKIKDDPRAGFAELVAECVTDADGNRFTVDEVTRLRAEVAKPIIEKVMEVNGLKFTTSEDEPEKN